MMKRADRKKIAKVALIIGIVLALVCHFLPHDYRVACEALAELCTGG